MVFYCCEDIKNECNGFITIQYLKNISSYIQNANGSEYIIPSTDENWKNNMYTPTYGELIGGELIPQHSNGVDGITIKGSYNISDKVFAHDMILTFYRLSSFTLSNDNIVIDACGGETTTMANASFSKFVKECGAEPIESAASIDNYTISWYGTDSINTGKKTFDKNGVYDPDCDSSNAKQRVAEVTASLNWRGIRPSSNSIILRQNTDEFDHLNTSHSSAVTEVVVNVSPWDFKNSCGEGTAAASAFYKYEEWDTTERVSKCGEIYCRIEKDNISTGTTSLPSSSHTVNICQLYAEDPLYNEGDVYRYEFIAEKDGLTDIGFAEWSCNNCGECQDIVTCNYISGYAETCGMVLLEYKETTQKQRKKEDGQCEIYDVVEENKTYTMNTEANETNKPRIISVTPPNGCLYGNTYQITQEAGPCNGCTGEKHFYEIGEITVSCDMSNATAYSAIYSATTTYDNCDNEFITGNTVISVPARECNYGAKRIIKNGSGQSGSTLAEAIENVIIYQEGNCDCCDVSTVYEYDANGITIPCDGIASASSATINYAATTTTSKCQTNTITGATVINVGPYNCNDSNSVKTLQNAVTGNTLSEAKPRIIQEAGPCCDCTNYAYVVNGLDQVFTINDPCGGTISINPTVKRRCTMPYEGTEWETVDDYAITLENGPGSGRFTINGNEISAGMICDDSYGVSGEINYVITHNGIEIKTGAFGIEQIKEICDECGCVEYGEYAFYINGPADVDEDNIEPCGGTFIYNIIGKRKCISPSVSTELDFTDFTLSRNGGQYFEEFVTVDNVNKRIIANIPPCCDGNCVESISGELVITYKENETDTSYTTKSADLSWKFADSKIYCSTCACATFDYSVENNACPSSITLSTCDEVNGSYDLKVIQECRTASTKTAYTTNYTVEWTQTDIALHENFVTFNGLNYTISKNCTDSIRVNTFSVSFKDKDGNIFKSCQNIVFNQAAGPCENCLCEEYEYKYVLSSSSSTVSNCGGSGSVPLTVYKVCKSPYHEQTGSTNEYTNFRIVASNHTPSDTSIYEGYEPGLNVIFNGSDLGWSVEGANCNEQKGLYKEVSISIYNNADNSLIASGILYSVKQDIGKCASMCGCDLTVYSASVDTTISVDECVTNNGSIPITVYSRCSSPTEVATDWEVFDGYTVKLERTGGIEFLTLPTGNGNLYRVSSNNCTTNERTENVRCTITINGVSNPNLTINGVLSNNVAIVFTQEAGLCADCECEKYTYRIKSCASTGNTDVDKCGGSGNLKVVVEKRCNTPYTGAEWEETTSGFTISRAVEGNSFVEISHQSSAETVFTVPYNCNALQRSNVIKTTIALVNPNDSFESNDSSACTITVSQLAGPCDNGSCGCISWAYSAECASPTAKTINSCGVTNEPLNPRVRKYCTNGGSQNEEYSDYIISAWSKISGDDFVSLSNNSYTAAKNCLGRTLIGTYSYSIVNNADGSTILSNCSITFSQGTCTSECCSCNVFSANTYSLEFDCNGSLISPSSGVTLYDNFVNCNNFVFAPNDSNILSSRTVNNVIYFKSVANIGCTSINGHFDVIDSNENEVCKSFNYTINPCSPCKRNNFQFSGIELGYDDNGETKIGSWAKNCDDIIKFYDLNDNLISESSATSGNLYALVIPNDSYSDYKTYSYYYTIGGVRCGSFQTTQAPRTCNCENNGSNLSVSAITTTLSSNYSRLVPIGYYMDPNCADKLIITSTPSGLGSLYSLYDESASRYQIIASEVMENTGVDNKQYTIKLSYASDESQNCTSFTIIQDARECNCDDYTVTIDNSGSTLTIQSTGTTDSGVKIGSYSARTRNCSVTISGSVIDSNGNIASGVTAYPYPTGDNINGVFGDIKVRAEANNTITDANYTVIIKAYPNGTGNKPCATEYIKNISVQGHVCSCSTVTSLSVDGDGFQNCSRVGESIILKYTLSDEVCSKYVTVNNSNATDFSIRTDKNSKFIWVTALTNEVASTIITVSFPWTTECTSRSITITKNKFPCDSLDFDEVINVEIPHGQTTTEGILYTIPYYEDEPCKNYDLGISGGGLNQYYKVIDEEYFSCTEPICSAFTVVNKETNAAIIEIKNNEGNITYSFENADTYTFTEPIVIEIGIDGCSCNKYIRITQATCDCNAINVNQETSIITNNYAIGDIVPIATLNQYDTSCGIKPYLKVNSNSASAVTVQYSGDTIVVIPKTNEATSFTVILYYNSNSPCKSLSVIRMKHCACSDIYYNFHEIEAPIHEGETVSARLVESGACYSSVSGECDSTAFTVSFSIEPSGVEMIVTSNTNEQAEGFVYVKLRYLVAPPSTYEMGDEICHTIRVYKNACNFTLSPSNAEDDCEGGSMAFRVI